MVGDKEVDGERASIMEEEAEAVDANADVFDREEEEAPAELVGVEPVVAEEKKK